MPLRLYRKRIGGNSSQPFDHYADIPLCGTNTIYDNGISVNGYAWKEYVGHSSVDFGLLTPSNTTIESMDVSGDNVKCSATSNTTTGDWVRGDVLINVGTSSWTIKVVKDNA